jgi:hypothetical protein
MEKKMRIPATLAAGLLLLMISSSSLTLGQEQGPPPGRIPQGIYIELTNDFYRALQEEGGGDTKFYSSDHSAMYLKQIAISSKFLVETNLQILKQQEEITRLLRSSLGEKKK